MPVIRNLSGDLRAIQELRHALPRLRLNSRRVAGPGLPDSTERKAPDVAGAQGVLPRGGKGWRNLSPNTNPAKAARSKFGPPSSPQHTASLAMMPEPERRRVSASTSGGSKPSCLISCSHRPPEGSVSALVGRHGAIKPAGRVRIRILNMAGYSAGGGKEKSPGRWWPGLKIAEYPAPEARGAQSISNDWHPPSAARLRSPVSARGALASSRKRPISCQRFLSRISRNSFGPLRSLRLREWRSSSLAEESIRRVQCLARHLLGLAALLGPAPVCFASGACSVAMIDLHSLQTISAAAPRNLANRRRDEDHKKQVFIEPSRAAADPSVTDWINGVASLEAGRPIRSRFLRSHAAQGER
jgi:hypothetical protein